MGGDFWWQCAIRVYLSGRLPAGLRRNKVAPNTSGLVRHRERKRVIIRTLRGGGQTQSVINNVG